MENSCRWSVGDEKLIAFICKPCNIKKARPIPAKDGVVAVDRGEKP